MSWNIGIRENTLVIGDNEVADRLIEDADANYQNIFIDDRSRIVFDSDAMEHMDFLWEDWALKALDDPSVNGDVVFMSAEGDNRGGIWGYRFKAGKMTELKAVVTMVEA